MSDQDIVNIVLTENDTQDESDDESEEKFHLQVPLKPLLNFWQ